MIITADDLGIAPEINAGIIEAHRRGLLSSASLLMNAPATQEAVRLARASPGLEIGIHLGIVEGLSLRGRPGSLTDPLPYLGDGPCLHRHWRPFLRRYLLGQIDLGELREELELQIQRFLETFPTIPFANATQHLHLLPRIREVVLDLCVRYRIGALRVPHRLLRATRARRAYSFGLARLGRQLLLMLPARLATTDLFAGFDSSGALRHARLLRLISLLPKGVTEIMTHPGHECRALREGLPWGYRAFSWAEELMALTSPEAREAVRRRRIEIVRFTDLRGMQS